MWGKAASLAGSSQLWAPQGRLEAPRRFKGCSTEGGIIGRATLLPPAIEASEVVTLLMIKR